MLTPDLHAQVARYVAQKAKEVAAMGGKLVSFNVVERADDLEVHFKAWYPPDVSHILLRHNEQVLTVEDVPPGEEPV